ncbi:MAG: MmcQ/YjbR family DNA-binding protein [Flavisolibacter sp.]
MVSIPEFRTIALSFKGAVELPHFDLISFRVNKKIFATLSEKHERAMLKLPLVEQSVFCQSDPNLIYAVPGSWGKQGCTYFELKKIRKAMLKDALTIAYSNLAAKADAKKSKTKKVSGKDR